MRVSKEELPSAFFKSRLAAKIAAVVIFSSALFGQQAASQSNTAQITIEAVSNSSATQGKIFMVTHYADESCAKRGKSEKIYKKRYAKDIHTFKPLEVEVGQPFIFQVSYLEKRLGEIRRCASLANVELKQDRDYRAVFSIVDEVLGCTIKIYDLSETAANPGETTPLGEASIDESGQRADDYVTENSTPTESIGVIASNLPMEIKFAKPAQTCSKVGKKGYNNGVAVYTYKERFS